MDIRISGQQIDTGSALQAHVTERMQDVVGKYFSRAVSSSVTFSKEPGGAFACNIVTHVTNGLFLKAYGAAHDMHLAFDQALTKIEKQLRRYKTRLKPHAERVLSRVRRRKRPIASSPPSSVRRWRRNPLHRPSSLKPKWTFRKAAWRTP